MSYLLICGLCEYDRQLSGCETAKQLSILMEVIILDEDSVLLGCDAVSLGV